MQGLTTPLGRASWRGNPKICDLLINVSFFFFFFKFFLYQKLGSDINYTGGQGITPLMWACIRDHRALIKDLIAKGANFNLESNDSKKNKKSQIYLK